MKTISNYYCSTENNRCKLNSQFCYRKKNCGNYPAAGMVRTHATTIFSVTLQRTADNRFADPTPDIAPVMTCVVDTGTPIEVAIKILAAAAVSAQKPSTGVSLVIFAPSS